MSGMVECGVASDAGQLCFEGDPARLAELENYGGDPWFGDQVLSAVAAAVEAGARSIPLGMASFPVRKPDGSVDQDAPERTLADFAGATRDEQLQRAIACARRCGQAAVGGHCPLFMIDRPADEVEQRLGVRVVYVGPQPVEAE